MSDGSDVIVIIIIMYIYSARINTSSHKNNDSNKVYNKCQFASLNKSVFFQMYNILRLPTTCECVHLVTRGHFRSRDKDGGHTIRSAIAENSTNFMAICFIKQELLPVEVLHCGIRNFRPFCFCDLDLDPMTFVYELDPYSLKTYRMCDSELSTLSKVIV